MALIDNPILNSPFLEPTRHFKFDEEGITDEILDGRRPSSHFVPIPRVKKKGKQLQFDTEWTKDRIAPNPVVDRIRQRIGAWRQGGYVGVTGTSSRLLAYWAMAEREKKLFFCQIEAVETAIYIIEVARKYGDTWIENDLRALARRVRHVQGQHLPSAPAADRVRARCRRPDLQGHCRKRGRHARAETDPASL
jgi:type III restriction enzyme